jgi:hypothetical protein
MGEAQKPSNPECQLIQLMNEDNNKNFTLLVRGNAISGVPNNKVLNLFQNPPIISTSAKIRCVGTIVLHAEN